MKYINYILLLLVVVTVSCTDHEYAKFEGPFYVAFEVDKSSLRERDGTIEIVIERSADTTALSRDETVVVEASAVYEANGEEAAGIFTIEGSNSNIGEVTIPAGDLSTTVTINTVDNDIEDGDKIVTIRITSAESLNVGAPGPDHLRSTHKLTVRDDDCPFDPAIWEGNYTVQQDYFNDETEEGSIFILEVTRPDPNNSPFIFAIDGFFFEARGQTLLYVDFDPCTGVVQTLNIPFIISDGYRYFATRTNEAEWLTRYLGINPDPNNLADWGKYIDDGQKRVFTLRGEITIDRGVGPIYAFNEFYTKL